jgi:drug/metabolite transporter (DMT)-like permease
MAPSYLSQRAKGVMLMLFGTLCISPDSVVVRFLVVHETASWSILTWKNIFCGSFQGIYVFAAAGGLKAAIAGVTAGPMHIALGAAMQAGLIITINLGFVHTTTARVLILGSLGPLWAALLGYAVLKDQLPRRTTAALLIALIAVGLIYVPALLGFSDDGAENVAVTQTQSDLGDLCAFSSGLFFAVLITVTRHASLYSANTNMTAAVMLGSYMAGLGSLIAAEAEVSPDLSGFSGPAWQFWLPLIGGGLGESIFCACASIAPALISGAEVGLIVLLEVILGPFFIFLAFGDMPPFWTLLGGSTLILTLAAHEVAPLFAKDETHVTALELKNQEGIPYADTARETEV